MRYDMTSVLYFSMTFLLLQSTYQKLKLFKTELASMSTDFRGLLALDRVNFNVSLLINSIQIQKVHSTSRTRITLDLNQAFYS